MHEKAWGRDKISFEKAKIKFLCNYYFGKKFGHRFSKMFSKIVINF